MRLILLTAFTLFCALRAEAQWYQVSGPVYDIAFTPSGVAFAAGAGGTMRKSADFGKTWQLLHSTVTHDLYAVCFINDYVGFACGGANDYEHTGLIKTTDGGITWRVIDPVYPPSVSLYEYAFKDIFFLDSEVGFMIDIKGAVLKTTDQGETWELITTSVGSTSSGSFNQVYFSNTQVGYACSADLEYDEGILHRSTDGGTTWTALNRNARHFQFAGGVLYALQGERAVLRSPDHGTTWHQYHVGVADKLTTLHFVNDTLGYATGTLGSIVKTVDGGITWNILQSNTGNSLFAIKSYNDHLVAAGASATLLAASAAGAWEVISLGPPDEYESLAAAFTGANSAIVAGTKGIFMRTDDGGATWRRQQVRSSTLLAEYFFKLEFVNDSVGYATGDRWDTLVVLRTADGGDTWTDISPPAMRGEPTSFAASETECFALSGYDVMMKTVNAGATWDTISEQSGFTMCIVNDTTAYLLDKYRDWLYKTTDDGYTWDLPPYYYFSANVTKIIKVDTVLFAGGDYLWKKYPSAAGWILINTGSSSSNIDDFTDIYFMDTLSGYAFDYGSSSYPTMFKTIDGGKNWTREYFNYYSPEPYSVAFSCCRAFAPARSMIYGTIFQNGLPTSVSAPRAAKRVLAVSPNPASNVLLIKTSGIHAQAAQVRVYDSNAREVMRQSVSLADGAPLQLPVADLINGIYSVVLSTADGVHTARFIKL